MGAVNRMWAVAVVTLTCVAVAPASAAEAPTRYSLAGGCYTLTGQDGQAVAGVGRIRMQATALGRYLLYTPERQFIAAQSNGSVAPANAPSPAADWKVDNAPGDAFTLSPMSAEGRVLTASGSLADPTTAGDAARLRFTEANGCADYPEAQLNARGRPAPSPTEYTGVRGLVEGHMHWMTFEYFGRRFHCGRPWHRYGIPHALPDCAEYEGPQGTAAPVQNTLNYGNPAQPHDTRGWPYLTEWRSSNLTYEGTYWRWIERAWLGGLRLMVMGINENRELCELQEERETNCNEMDTVRRGLQDIKELQDYVDAQAGGPGKGFFQIVRDPYEAREVINQGRMAVVLEIEISEPFDCRGWDQPTCDRAQVDRQLDEMLDAGVRSMLLLNKFDNPLTGVRFDSGPVGAVINAGNRRSSGSYWSARTCEGPLRDNTIFQPEPQSAAALDALITGLGFPSGTAPVYPPPPHCNTRGLTELGRHVVRRLMDAHAIVNPDHMSQAAVDDTLTLLESRDYSGVISPHGWMDPGNWPRLWKLGGVAFPGHSDATDYVDEWKRFRPEETPYAFGWGYGADLGGLSQQPRTPEGESISYPFKSYDGEVTFERQTTGERTFDYTKEGVAHYGLYPEWFEDLRRLGGEQMAEDMSDGAEAYLQMWERADGIPTRSCDHPRRPLSGRGFGRLRLGLDWGRQLRRAGQPQQRTRVWTWCVRGKRNRTAADVAILTRNGLTTLVGSNARGRTLRGVRVGSKMASAASSKRLRIRFRRTRKGAEVIALRGRRVRAVALASHKLSVRPKALRKNMRKLVRARATQARREFRPNEVQAARAGRPTGRPLAGTSNDRLNAALAYLCSLQVQGRPG